MSLHTHEPLTEKVLLKLTQLEPMFSMTTGAALELFGFNDLRKQYRMKRYLRERKKREQMRVKRAFRNLVKADLVTVAKGRNGFYQLTPKGWIKYATLYARQFKKKEVKKGKAFILVFDIPEMHRGFRDTLRNVLYSLGFAQLQRSVFITHDREAFQFASRVVANCELEDRVKFVVADKVF